MINLNELQELVAIIQVEDDINLEYFVDLDSMDGYAGQDIIVLAEKRIIICNKEIEGGVRDLLERSKSNGIDDEYED